MCKKKHFNQGSQRYWYGNESAWPERPRNTDVRRPWNIWSFIYSTEMIKIFRILTSWIGKCLSAFGINSKIKLGSVSSNDLLHIYKNNMVNDSETTLIRKRNSTWYQIKKEMNIIKKIIANIILTKYLFFLFLIKFQYIRIYQTKILTQLFK